MKNIELEKITIRPSQLVDVTSIVELIKSAPEALVPVNEDEVASWIKQGHSLVALNDDDEVVGHQGVAIWPESGWFEVRSAVVKAEYRGKGINSKMKEVMIAKVLEENTDATLVGFTEAASKSRGILTRMGFTKIPMEEVPGEFFTICPESCFKKTGKDCGCVVFTLKNDC